MPWEFEGLGTILSAWSPAASAIAAVPRLALAAGERRVVVRELPGAALARDVYAVARTASVRRPSVAVILAALHSGARHLPGRRAVPANTAPSRDVADPAGNPPARRAGTP